MRATTTGTASGASHATAARAAASATWSAASTTTLRGAKLPGWRRCAAASAMARRHFGSRTGIWEMGNQPASVFSSSPITGSAVGSSGSQRNCTVM